QKCLLWAVDPSVISLLCYVPAAEPCTQPLEEGGCQRYTLRWYYNQRAAECRPFVYSGCQGNLNRFSSQEECELHCRQRMGTGGNSRAISSSSITPGAVLGATSPPPAGAGSGEGRQPEA
uniref:BPTI/Kunitz inhibitor domain-containing protein n=1 Tax=Coturnix japonica TaxID=93934 RepID=A0A8C2TTW5_COTJA